MTAATLWIEITIGGFVYLVGICFVVLAAYRVGDFRALQSLKDCLPYLSAGAVAASYVIGMVAHRVVQVLVAPIFRRVERLFGLQNPVEVEQLKVDIEQMTVIWQLGSARIHREIDFQYAQVVLLRSFLFSLLFLTFSVAAWLVRIGRSSAWFLVILLFLFWAACFIAHGRQWHQYKVIRAAALKAVVPNTARKTALFE